MCVFFFVHLSATFYAQIVYTLYHHRICKEYKEHVDDWLFLSLSLSPMDKKWLHNNNNNKKCALCMCLAVWNVASTLYVIDFHLAYDMMLCLSCFRARRAHILNVSWLLYLRSYLIKDETFDRAIETHKQVYQFADISFFFLSFSVSCALTRWLAGSGSIVNRKISITQASMRKTETYSRFQNLRITMVFVVSTLCSKWHYQK